MANLQPCGNAPTGSSRTGRAVTAYLTLRGVKDMSDVDWADPAIQGFSVQDINTALESIKSINHDSLSGRIRRWMGDSDRFSVGGILDGWLPVRTTRYANLRTRNVITGRTLMVYSHIDVFQVVYAKTYKNGMYHLVYHIQSVIDGDPGHYFRKVRNMRGTFDFERLVNVNPVDLSPKRNAGGAIGEATQIKIMNHKESVPVDQKHPSWEVHRKLHQQVTL